MATYLNEASLEKKLTNVTNTQDGIQTLSLWMIHHKVHYKKIVETWLKVLKNGKVSHRLTLYNLANDVIQNSRRKGFTKYADAFGKVFSASIPLVKDEKILPSILRIYKIWEDRSVYDASLIREWSSLLEVNSTEKVVSDFKTENLFDGIKKATKAHLDVENKFQIMSNLKVDASSFETLNALKDRTLGQQFSTDFEESTKCLEEYVQLLSNAVTQKKKLVDCLDGAIVYYATQRNEAKIVSNAYKNYGSKIKNLKKKLEEKIRELPSPVASPNPNAPSPSPSESEDLFADHATKGGESPPSPIGTPEELKFSPTTELADSTGNKNDTADVLPFKSVIPGIADGDQHAIDLNQSTTQNDGAMSLDSRLSSLMENMQKLPPCVFNSLFGKSSEDSHQQKMKNSPIFGTPLNDEPSGHETPLQDETLSDFKNPTQSGALPKLTSNNIPAWASIEGATSNLKDLQNIKGNNWGLNNVSVATNAFKDKDERVPIGANIQPMDMDLDDEEMEDSPDVIIESSNVNSDCSTKADNLITLVEGHSGSQNEPAVKNIRDELHNSVSIGKASSDNVDNELYFDTQRLIEQQLSQPEDIFPDKVNNYASYTSHGDRNNYRLSNNSDNHYNHSSGHPDYHSNRRNNAGSTRPSKFRGRSQNYRNHRPYRAPRWRY